MLKGNKNSNNSKYLKTFQYNKYIFTNQQFEK
jgi:hypothetical protein